jgi:serine/threonine-protein kinase
MPDVTGQQEAAATQALADQGLTNVATEEVESDQPAGTVLGSNPSPGNQVDAGTRITLQVSGGVTTLTVPDVIGQTEAAARAALQSAGFTNVQVQPTENDGTVEEGEVVNTNPAPGSSAAPDDAVVLLIATGPPPEGN